MNEKWVWAGGSAGAGVVLCVFGGRALSAVAITVGAAAVAGGIFLFFTRAKYRERLALCFFLFSGGVLTIVLCAAFKSAAAIASGVVITGAAVALFAFALCLQKRLRGLQAVFCAVLGIFGAVLLFSPPFIDFFCRVFGGGLIIFCGVFAVLWQ